MRFSSILVLLLLVCAMPAWAEGPVLQPDCTITLTHGNEADLATIRFYDGAGAGKDMPPNLVSGQPAGTRFDCRQVGFKDGQHYLRTSAVDTSGHESALSDPAVPFVLQDLPRCDAPRITVQGEIDYPEGGTLRITWSKVPCAVKYRLRVHQADRPYDPSPDNFAYSGDDLADDFVVITIKPGMRYDAWIRSLDADGREFPGGTGTVFTIKMPPIDPPPPTPPPPPPPLDPQIIQKKFEQLEAKMVLMDAEAITLKTQLAAAEATTATLKTQVATIEAAALTLTGKVQAMDAAHAKIDTTLAAMDARQRAMEATLHARQVAIETAANRCNKAKTCSGKTLAKYTLEELAKIP